MDQWGKVKIKKPRSLKLIRAFTSGFQDFQKFSKFSDSPILNFLILSLFWFIQSIWLSLAVLGEVDKCITQPCICYVGRLLPQGSEFDLKVEKGLFEKPIVVGICCSILHGLKSEKTNYCST